KPANGRFPLLLKFIDARQELSVQVHPNDAQARAKKPGQAGKTEAWVVLDADPAASKIYAGFRPGVTPAAFRAALADRAAPRALPPGNAGRRIRVAGEAGAAGRLRILHPAPGDGNEAVPRGGTGPVQGGGLRRRVGDGGRGAGPGRGRGAAAGGRRGGGGCAR